LNEGAIKYPLHIRECNQNNIHIHYPGRYEHRLRTDTHVLARPDSSHILYKACPYNILPGAIKKPS
jgi:hypothetical protein